MKKPTKPTAKKPVTKAAPKPLPKILPKKPRDAGDQDAAGKRKRKTPAHKDKSIVVCWVHGGPISRALAHEHHVVPHKADGDDTKANLKFLCASCHHNIHQIGTAIQFNRAADAVELLSTNYQSPGARRRAGQLAKIVAFEFTAQKERGGPSFHVVPVNLSDRTFKTAQIIARERGAGSVERLLRRLLKEAIRQQAGFRAVGVDGADGPDDAADGPTATPFVETTVTSRRRPQ